MSVDQPHGLGRVTDPDHIKTETMVGDVRDLLLQEARDTRSALPWTSRSEKEQREIIEKVDVFAGKLVRSVARAMAIGANPCVQVMVDSWKVKDGVTITCKASTTPGNLEILANDGNTPLLVFVDLEALKGERSPIVPLKDQPDLGDNDDEGPVFDRTGSGDR